MLNRNPSEIEEAIFSKVNDKVSQYPLLWEILGLRGANKQNASLRWQNILQHYTCTCTCTCYQKFATNLGKSIQCLCVLIMSLDPLALRELYPISNRWFVCYFVRISI